MYDFNKRRCQRFLVLSIVSILFALGWHEEMQPDCRIPTVDKFFPSPGILLTYLSQHRRLTREMRRELVKCLRTVALLAMFSQDSTTVTNIQSALKSMSVMEPDLILHSILERAVPSLETLVEVCIPPSRHMDPSHLICLDSKDDCGHQSVGCCSTSNRLARSILRWGETSNPYLTTTNTWYRSCTPFSALSHAHR